MTRSNRKTLPIAAAILSAVSRDSNEFELSNKGDP
jgi:hypothetical protein